MGPEREGMFAKLRAERPISFQEEFEPPPEMAATIPQGPGYWALTRYADVMQVSRDPDTFHSAPTTTITDMPGEIAEWLGSMINMDAPKHTKLRLIVNRGFTPRQIARDRGIGTRASERHRRHVVEHGRVRLRLRDRGGAPPADHLRHDGHPARRHQDHLRVHEHDPGCRRPRVREHDGRPHGRGDGPLPIRPRARRRPPEEPAQRHHHDAHASRSRRRKRRAQAHRGRARFVLLAPRRRRATRPRATRSATA